MQLLAVENKFPSLLFPSLLERDWRTKTNGLRTSVPLVSLDPFFLAKEVRLFLSRILIIHPSFEEKTPPIARLRHKGPWSCNPLSNLFRIYLYVFLFPALSPVAKITKAKWNTPPDIWKQKNFYTGDIVGFKAVPARVSKMTMLSRMFSVENKTFKIHCQHVCNILQFAYFVGFGFGDQVWGLEYAQKLLPTELCS